MTISLPRAFCGKCRVPFSVKANGVVLNCIIRGTRSYYKVHADAHECPSCGVIIYAGFGQPTESFRADFAEIRTDVDIRLEP